MPAIFLIPLFVFAFTVGKASNARVDVIHIDDGRIKNEEKVLGPILVLKEEDGFSIRSGFELKGKYRHTQINYIGDMAIFDMADDALREIKAK